MADLTGRRVLVTGGSGGLGSRVAARLAGAGARLALVARDADRLAAAAPEGATLLPADLRRPEEPARVVAAAVEALGGLDAVVVAHGVVAFGAVEDLDAATLATLFATNALSPALLLAAAVPHLVASAEAGRTPVVLHVSAVVAERPTAGMAAYSASKAALTALDAAAARELRRRGVRVVDARPPHTGTGLAERPLTGTAPALGAGLDPDAVADRLVRALVDDERDLPASAFDAG
ncbi:SDR family NAD(P)-dependent oxidoreductase [Cellulomonas endophytica]|uniref:SDR family NAD(P)-dependent oxidoreductase n=1 Tax=Cellulomonas endophytica TaxID=2494735 RepID=UPI00196B6913|nr:SDR family NAD(P)-dependent oxidoreductase [Cellulomonas endophytica]